ncbi:MAG TPA: hypothetical protein DC049_05180 [Spirochaetia bacterium]|nr:hypothetical protein [Spirochaetia bacterium]
MRSADETLTGICFESGFRDFSYFSKTFRKITVLTPSSLRKKNLKKSV